jgi:hypothetical protein
MMVEPFSRATNVIPFNLMPPSSCSMKKLIIPTLMGISALTLLSGCIDLSVGGGSACKQQSATTGQQLIDLQKAKDAGAISDAEYQAERAKVLGKH